MSERKKNTMKITLEVETTNWLCEKHGLVALSKLPCKACEEKS